jgi:phage gpG-like protein
MALLRVDIRGRENLQERLDRLSDIPKREILDQASSNALHRMQYRFLHTQKGADGEPWVQSDAAKRRLAGKDKKWKGGDTLFRSGDLFRSLQVFEDGDPDERSIGTDLLSGKQKGDKPGIMYGLFHQYGKGKMYRPFVGLGEEDHADLTKIIRYHLEKIVGNNDAA